MLPDPRSHKLHVGLKQSKKAIVQGKAAKAFVAKDADEFIVSEMRDLCLDNVIPIEYVENMRQLGKACDIDVGAAVAVQVKD